jgi:hypothetical protein
MIGPTGNVASNAGRASGPGAILHLKAKAPGHTGWETRASMAKKKKKAKKKSKGY